MFLTLFLTSLAAHGATPLQVDLAVDDRWALISGLKDRVGGDFILTGLADAGGLCSYAGTCVTTEQLSKRDAIGRDSGIRTVADLMTTIRVRGDAPRTVVALRGAQVVRRGLTHVYLSVYDPGTGRWDGKVATLVHRYGNPGTDGNLRTIGEWQDAPAFDA